MKIWKVVWKDRHIDDEITVHASLEAANAALEDCIKYDRYGNNFAEEDTDWVRYVAAEHDDGPRGYIEEGDLILPGEPAQEVARVVVFVEGRFYKVVELDSLGHAAVFGQGFCMGIEKFAQAAVYLYPQDADELLREEPRDQVRAALDAMGVR